MYNYNMITTVLYQHDWFTQMFTYITTDGYIKLYNRAVYRRELGILEPVWQVSMFTICQCTKSFWLIYVSGSDPFMLLICWCYGTYSGGWWGRGSLPCWSSPATFKQVFVRQIVIHFSKDLPHHEWSPLHLDTPDMSAPNCGQPLLGSVLNNTVNQRATFSKHTSISDSFFAVHGRWVLVEGTLFAYIL